MTKPPKEPKTFKHPRLYWREDGEEEYWQRLRIIYPNGDAEWGCGAYFWYGSCWASRTPCWADPKKIKNGHEAVRLMKGYDRQCGYETIFLGEIR
jgi:hypothetical protein